MQALHTYFSRARVLVAALGIMLFLPAGRHGEELAVIDSPITQDLFEKHKYLFSAFSVTISSENMFVYENLNFFTCSE